MPDIVTGKIFVDGEKGITATKMNQIISQSVIQTDFFNNKATSSALGSTDQLLTLQGGTTYATITGSNLTSSVGAGLTPTITAVRLRSFNSVGNPGFEVDQRNVGNTVVNPASGTVVMDRWRQGKTGTMTVNTAALSIASGIAVPGTNFLITRGYLWINLTGQETTLAATDLLNIVQTIEGPQLRELIGDVHSLSILASTNVSGGLKFGVTIRDSPQSKAYTHLCTIPSSGTNTLFTIPNIPVFPSGGNWSLTPGAVGYEIVICLAAGSSVTTSANDTWVNSTNFVGAVGQDNFASKPLNSTLNLCFVQHEPGNQCTTLMDKAFTQNYDECLRYYCKSYDYDVALGTANAVGYLQSNQASTTVIGGTVRFPKALAKIPTTTTIYNLVTGATNSIRMGGVDYAVSALQGLGKGGFAAMTTATLPAVVAGAQAGFHYAADTGW